MVFEIKFTCQHFKALQLIFVKNLNRVYRDCAILYVTCFQTDTTYSIVIQWRWSYLIDSELNYAVSCTSVKMETAEMERGRGLT